MEHQPATTDPSSPQKLESDSADNSLLARQSLRDLLDDDKVPAEIRSALADEYNEVERLLKKLEQNEIHVSVFGRVSVGKSSLLNALMGKQAFSVSALHGETKEREQHHWDNPTVNDNILEQQSGGVHFIDTPGIDEVDGETRELIARNAATRSDIILFVVDSDMTQTEFQAMQLLSVFTQPMLLVLNKSDLYSEEERNRLLEHLRSRVRDMIPPNRVLATMAKLQHKKIRKEKADGSFEELQQDVLPNVSELREKIWKIVEQDGRTLAALNASMFASDLSDDIGRQVLNVRRELAKEIIVNYSLAKGLAVAANPIPVADLVAAAGLDASMVLHLSRLHGLPMSREEAGELVKVIATQLALLMGTTWAVNAISTALKVGTAGLSTFFTAAVQGSIAYYATIVLGRVAETWLAQGKSWGTLGPKVVVNEILENLDRNSIIQEGRSAILEKLGR